MPGVRSVQKPQDNSLSDAMTMYNAYQKVSDQPQKVEITNKDFTSTGEKKEVGLGLDGNKPVIDSNNYDPNLTGEMGASNMPAASDGGAQMANNSADAMQRRMAMQQAQTRPVTAPGKPQDNSMKDAQSIGSIIAMMA